MKASAGGQAAGSRVALFQPMHTPLAKELTLAAMVPRLVEPVRKGLRFAVDALDYRPAPT